MSEIEEIMNSMILELRRGTIVLSVLSQLNTPQYGYTLVKKLEERDVVIDTNTLYPLLRRLEKQDLLKSEWETEGSKPRKYYVRTDLGNRVFTDLREQWNRMVLSMNGLMQYEQGNRDNEHLQDEQSIMQNNGHIKNELCDGGEGR